MQQPVGWYEPTPATNQPGSLNDAPGNVPINGVTVRTLQDTPDDTTFAGKIMVDAFEGKFAHSLTKEKLPIAKRVVASFYHQQRPWFYTRNLVAELDGRRVGLVSIKFKGDKPEDRGDNVCDLGCYRACRFMCFGIVMDTKVDDRRKCLIEAIGVEDWARGRGVGKVLLDRAEWEARKMGCSILYLMVITTNRAQRLYERHGFKTASTHSNCCFECVAGPPGSYHVMEKLLL